VNLKDVDGVFQLFPIFVVIKRFISTVTGDDLIKLFIVCCGGKEGMGYRYEIVYILSLVSVLIWTLATSSALGFVCVYVDEKS